MRIGKIDFDFKNKTYVMGILNVTPDSFSDGGKYNTLDSALKHTERMVSEGAAIIDVGGESTKPGYIPVSCEEQIARVVPVIEGIRKNFDIPVSVDTADAQVAKAALEAGCSLVNDIRSLQGDENMRSVVANAGVPCVIMHNRANMDYTDFMSDVKTDLEKYCRDAVEAGIDREKIIIDPGVGFAKTYEQNLAVINRLEEFQSMGYPVLLGTSRKSVIGLTLDLPIYERVEGTIATTVMAVMKGAAIVRVHDVKENVRAIRMTEAILQK